MGSQCGVLQPVVWPGLHSCVKMIASSTFQVWTVQGSACRTRPQSLPQGSQMPVSSSLLCKHYSTSCYKTKSHYMDICTCVRRVNVFLQQCLTTSRA